MSSIACTNRIVCNRFRPATRSDSLKSTKKHAERVWRQWLSRRTRGQPLSWDRFNRLLTEDNPAIVPYQPEGDAEFAALTGQPTEIVLDEFLCEREALCRRLEALPPADWHRKGRHPEYEHYDVHFQAEYMAHHEAHHIYQLFQRRVPLGKLPH